MPEKMTLDDAAALSKDDDEDADADADDAWRRFGRAAVASCVSVWCGLIRARENICVVCEVLRL